MHVRNVWTGGNLHQIAENHYKKMISEILHTLLLVSVWEAISQTSQIYTHAAPQEVHISHIHCHFLEVKEIPPSSLLYTNVSH